MAFLLPILRTALEHSRRCKSIKKDQLWISSRDEEKSVKIDYYDAGTNFPFFSYCRFVIPTLCIYV